MGDYELQWKPVDISINPRLSHLKPGLLVRGDVLENSLVKTTKIGNDWTEAKGLRGRIHGEINTYGNSSATLNLEAFKRWQGPLTPGINGTFEVSGGSYTDLLNKNSGVGMHFRQEIRGGHFSVAGHDMSYHIDGKQDFGYRLTGNAAPDSSGSRKQMSYEFLFGARKDFPTNIWGRSGTIVVVAGPQIHGDQDKAFEVRPKVDVRLRF